MDILNTMTAAYTCKMTVMFIHAVNQIKVLAIGCFHYHCGHLWLKKQWRTQHYYNKAHG